MKKLMFILPLFALLTGLAGAFITKANPAPANLSTAVEWVYIDAPGNNENNQTSYALASEHPGITCGESEDKVCKIIANEDGVSGYPDLLGQSPRDPMFFTTYRE